MAAFERNRRSTPEMEQQMSATFADYASKPERRYDVLVLFSGGKDSAYLLHRLRTEFPSLRVLAVTVDNGFFSEVAMANCRRILDRIDGVDHLVFRPEKNIYVKAFRHAFTHHSKDGCYSTVDRMDGDLTFDIGRNLTASLQIPLLIAGLSPEQVERILRLNNFESPQAIEHAARIESAGFRLEEIFEPTELQRYWWNGGMAKRPDSPSDLSVLCLGLRRGVDPRRS